MTWNWKVFLRRYIIFSFNKTHFKRVNLGVIYTVLYKVLTEIKNSLGDYYT